MNLSKKLAVIIILFAAISNLNAQSGDKIRIILQQPPPGKLGVADIWSLSITNTTNENLTVHVGGIASEEKDGLIIEAKSKPFTIKPGTTKYKHTDFSSAEIKYNNGKYKEILMRTGNAPEGNYTICVTAYNESGEIIGQENCITQSVQQLGSISLISPPDGEELDPDTLPGLTFSWTPLPKGGPYTLRIVELKGDQSPETAIQTNRPVWEKEGITNTSVQVPWVAIDEPGVKGKWSWIVTSGDVKSEVYTFRYSEKKFTLISPSDGEEISPEKTLNFSWTKVPGNSGYTLRIVELKGDQSPDEAFRSNQPIFEKELRTTTFQGDPIHGIDVKLGMKYAWQVTSGDKKSEISSFRYGERKLTLISPSDGEKISPEKPINFLWNPVPGNSGYTLRIVELKGDQSPETAFKNNSDVFTVIGNTAGYTFRGGEHLPWPLPKKKKYAWQVTGGNFQSETFTFITSLSSDTTAYIEHKFDLPVDLIVYDEEGNVKTLILKTKDGGFNIFEVKSYQPGIPVYGDYDGCRTVYCNNPNHPPGCGWKECNK